MWERETDKERKKEREIERERERVSEGERETLRKIEDDRYRHKISSIDAQHNVYTAQPLLSLLLLTHWTHVRSYLG